MGCWSLVIGQKVIMQHIYKVGWKDLLHEVQFGSVHKYNDIIERGLIMWVSSIMDGNRQERKWLIVEHKVLKWAKRNNAPPKDHFTESPWEMKWVWHDLHDYDDYKTKETWMHKMHEQRGWVVWCPHLLHKVFRIWPFLTLNWKCFSHLIEEQPNQGEGLGCI